MLFERRAWVKFPLFMLIPATAECKHCFPDDDKIRTGAVTHFNQSSSSEQHVLTRGDFLQQNNEHIK